MKKLLGTAVRYMSVAGLLCAIVILMIPIWMRATIDPYLAMLPRDLPHTDAAVILGASVVRGSPSPILAARTDAAIELYRLGKVSKVLITGDAESSSHDEVTPVRDYLMNAGIPQKDILLDYEGIDTYRSMYGLTSMFGIKSATIVTQDFHLPRSVFVARSVGVDAYGYASDNRVSSWYNYIREIPASVKALWDVRTHRIPLLSQQLSS